VGVAPGLGELPKLRAFPSIFLQRLKLATSNLMHSLGLPRPIIKSHPEEKWGWPWTRGAPQNLGFPCNISATAGASDFKFGTQLGFAKAHHRITHVGTSTLAMAERPREA